MQRAAHQSEIPHIAPGPEGHKWEHTLGETGVEADVSWPAVLEPVLATIGMKIKRYNGEHGSESDIPLSHYPMQRRA